MSDWDDDVPNEQPLTRGQRFRDSIARAVIRPGSAATGEQILRFQEDQAKCTHNEDRIIHEIQTT